MLIYHGSDVIVSNPKIKVAKFRKPNHQISFNTERALQALKFITAEKVYE